MVFDPLLHQTVRSKLISLLIMGVTDGNLSSHLSKLEKEEFVLIEKKFVGKRPKTVVHITPKGRERFAEYIEALKKFIEKN